MPYADPQMAKAADARRYLVNREKKIAQAAAWAAANPERRREIARESQGRKYVRDPQKCMAAVSKSKKKRLASDPEFAQRDREKHADRVALRRARMRDAPYEVIDRQVVFERDEGICGICGEPANRLNWHLDHIVPVAKGGAHTYENVQVSHPSCNCSKGDGSHSG